MKQSIIKISVVIYLMCGIFSSLSAQKIRLAAGQTLTGPTPITVTGVGQLRLVMLSDGNIEMAAIDTQNKMKWHSGSLGKSIYKAVMGTDGELSMLTPTNVVVWTSDTRDDEFMAGGYMEVDLARGSAAIYDVDGYLYMYLPKAPIPDGFSTVSATNLGLKSGQTLVVNAKIEVAGVGYLTLKSNGDLQAYDAAGVLKWRSGGFQGVNLTSPSGMAKMGTDGVLSIVNGTTTVWTSYTGGQGWYMEVNMVKGRAAIYGKDGTEVLMLPWQKLDAGATTWETYAFSPATSSTYCIGGSFDGLVKSCADGVFICNASGVGSKVNTTTYKSNYPYPPTVDRTAGKITTVAMLTKDAGVLVEDDGELIFIDPVEPLYDKSGNILSSISSTATRTYDKSAPPVVTDAAVGVNGRVWLLSKIPVTGGYALYTNTSTDLDTTKWIQIPGIGAKHIAADKAGNAWVVNDKNEIFTIDLENKVVKHATGYADDIAADGSGNIFIRRGKYDIYRFLSGSASSWYALPRLGFELSGLATNFPYWTTQYRDAAYVIRKDNGAIHRCINYQEKNQIEYGKADLVIIEGTYNCETRKVKVSVCNRGDRASKATILGATTPTLNPCLIKSEDQLPIIQPGQCYSWEFELATTTTCSCRSHADGSKFLAYPVRFTVDKYNTTEEVDEYNNNFTVWY